MEDYLREARAIRADLITLRHDLHRHPEIGLELPGTQQRILDAVADLPLEITRGSRLSSVTAVLRGGGTERTVGDRPVVLLRADMDGLPVLEDTSELFASTIPGAMHACGHDLHMTALVGAVRLLCEHRDSLPGDVVFMFQPGEEQLLGASLMIDDGVLDISGKRVDRAFALHAFSSLLPHGVFATRPGTILAASDTLIVDIVGTGGHGSTPSLANDPVPVMAEVILALQTLVTRRFSVFDPVVITVGVATAGTAANVIPERCHLECSIRSFSVEHRRQVERMAQDQVRGICEAHGMRADITWRAGVGPTVCDPDATAFARAQIEAVLGAGRHITMDQPLAGSEDFSEILARVPGSFVVYSGVPAGLPLEEATFNHSATALFDDAILPDAAAVLARIAHACLVDLQTTQS